jgi:hypothetical protein
MNIYEPIPKFDETKYMVVQKPPVKTTNGLYYGVEIVPLPPQEDVVEEFVPFESQPKPIPEPSLEERIKALEEMELERLFGGAL